jgi:hypothetical protein
MILDLTNDVLTLPRRPRGPFERKRPVSRIQLAKKPSKRPKPKTAAPFQLAKKPHHLTRIASKFSRLAEFCTQRELTYQIGHDTWYWLLVILKELADNGIDSAEDAEIAPVITVTVKGRRVIVRDNGPGIPETTVESILDYSTRTSTREAYVSPTRGAQGNALKTILAMAYVLDKGRGEAASGITVVEAQASRIIFAFRWTTSRWNRRSSTPGSARPLSRAPASPSPSLDRI